VTVTQTTAQVPSGTRQDVNQYQSNLMTAQTQTAAAAKPTGAALLAGVAGAAYALL
jgi:hypothetical protein